MSIARNRPWWVTSLSRARSLRTGIVWTVLTALNLYLSQEPRVWALMLVAAGVGALLAVSGWAGYVFYRRHPEAEPIHPGSGASGE